MTNLDIRMLGGFEARFDGGQVISSATRKTDALLAYLALSRGKPKSRDHLSGLLWSDRAEGQARSSLRQSLSALRRVMHDKDKTILQVEGETISLAADSLEVDVVEFESLAAEGSTGNLGLADELYQGQLLDGLKVRDPVFNEWLDAERFRLDNLAVNVLEQLLAILLKERRTDAAIAAAQRLIARDPLRESAYRTLMRLYSAQSQRGLAAREFDRCRETLAAELQIEPSPATLGLYKQILASDSAYIEPNSMTQATPAPPPLPSKPSLVILSFANLSGDPDQSYLSEGLTEDVITSMSRFQSLFVIGVESALVFNERTSSYSEIAHDLGVEYVVNGSVRKSGDSLRVTAQLIDPFTGHRLWTERYDRQFSDIFEIQDEIVANIVSALSINIERARVELTRYRSVDMLGAYDCCLRARQCLWKWTADGFAEARFLFEKAASLDPAYAPAWAGLARVCNKQAHFQPGIDPDPSLASAHEFAQKAVAIDGKSGLAYAQLSWTYLCLGDHELARECLGLATRFDPNESEVLNLRVYVLGFLGDYDAALEAAEFGLRVNPFNRDYYLDAKGMTLFFMGRERESSQTSELIQNTVPDCLAWNAAIYALVGDQEAAERTVERFVREFGAIWKGDPEAGAPEFAHWVAYVANPFVFEEHRQRLVEGMRLAGLPI
ncbi:MAG: BTAD domain-containing putative transcriptional regulator [Anderseniella sp.]